MPKMKLVVKNLYGTPRYFPACPMSEALCKLRGRNNKTLLLNHINALNEAGFSFQITDWNGEVIEL